MILSDCISTKSWNTSNGVKTSFLNRYLEEEIYIEQPKGFYISV